MSEIQPRVAATVTEIERLTHGGPRPIQILVAPQKDNPAEYSAMAIQYSVIGQGETPREAVEHMLSALIHYLHSCKDHDVHPVSYCTDDEHERFDCGVKIFRTKLDIAQIMALGESFEVREPRPHA